MKHEEVSKAFVGQVILNQDQTSQYKLEKNLRTNGQYSTIFIAKVLQNQLNPQIIGQEVIIKVLKKEMAKYNDREIKAHNVLQNARNVLRMYDLCEHMGFQCLVLEYCNGGDLEHYKNYFKRHSE